MSRNEECCGLPTEVHDLLKALASETRQKMIFLFRDGQPRTVGQVAQALGMGMSTTSEHLALLRRGGMLASSREGKEVYYRPDRKRFVVLLQKLSDLLMNCCPE